VLTNQPYTFALCSTPSFSSPSFSSPANSSHPKSIHNRRHVHSFDEVAVAAESRQQYTIMYTAGGSKELLITQIHRLHLHVLYRI